MGVRLLKIVAFIINALRRVRPANAASTPSAVPREFAAHLGEWK